MLQGKDVFLFLAVSRHKCWWQGEGGMHWACGGDIMMQSSADSGGTWPKPKACLLRDYTPEFMHGLCRSHSEEGTRRSGL